MWKMKGKVVKEALVMMSGFTEATSLGKYLGVPLVGRALKRSDYNYVINQVKTKLSAWKGKHLSFVGRVTLSKAVIILRLFLSIP
jgi:hypothetical protein